MFLKPFFDFVFLFIHFKHILHWRVKVFDFPINKTRYVLVTSRHSVTENEAFFKSYNIS